MQQVEIILMAFSLCYMPNKQNKNTGYKINKLSSCCDSRPYCMQQYDWLNKLITAWFLF